MTSVCLSVCDAVHCGYSYSYRNTLFNKKRFVLRGVMQYKLVETSRSSALIGTAGDCCVGSECQVEVRSRPSEPQWRNFAGRYTCLPAKRTGHHGQANEVTDVTNPRLGR